MSKEKNHAQVPKLCEIIVDKCSMEKLHYFNRKCVLALTTSI